MTGWKETWTRNPKTSNAALPLHLRCISRGFLFLTDKAGIVSIPRPHVWVIKTTLKVII